MNVPELDSEHWYMMRDKFMRYIEVEVNAARVAADLQPIREHEARECYRILYEFWSKFDK